MKIMKKYYKAVNRNRSLIKNSNIITYFIVFVTLVFIIIGSILIKLGIDTRGETIPLYTFSAEKNSNYEILLKPNEFYDTETLPAGRYYASQSINDIKINFKYNFNENENVKINYNYTITADLVGNVNIENNSSPEIWSKTFTLLTSNNEENQNSINSDINIDYDFFYNLARSYESNYGIVIDATLKVKFNIYYNINLSSFNLNSINGEDYIELDIPITNTVANVKENYQNTTTQDVFEEHEKINIKEISFYIVGGMLILGALIIAFLLIRNINSNKTPREIYEDTINYILKYYKELIVTVNNEPNLTNLEIINVANFEDLIDVAEQNKRNIIHFAIANELKSKLYVIVENYVYMYIVSNKNI